MQSKYWWRCDVIVEIVGIILNSVLSTIAVVVSIVAINRQRQSQNINANIQLFDKRFEIYNFVLDIWYIVGYFEGALDANKMTHKYSNIIEIVKRKKLEGDIAKRVEYAYINAKKYLRMQECLFEGKISEYLDELLSNFETYIFGIHLGMSIGADVEELAYQNLLNLRKTEKLDVEEMRQYLDLSDVKRLYFK